MNTQVKGTKYSVCGIHSRDYEDQITLGSKLIKEFKEKYWAEHKTVKPFITK